ncbi:MAG: hypothetical protein LBH40_04050 [Alphaproteobacteria bacterium]|jgi:hypothetical protein|nr:hypothetical protein [Alphaproteobacteria bacterium]
MVNKVIFRDISEIRISFRISLEDRIIYGKEFWDKSAYVEDKGEYQCILEQVYPYYVAFNNIRSINFLEDLKKVRIFKKPFRNVLYCKDIDSEISKQIIENSEQNEKYKSKKESKEELGNGK